MNDANPDIFHFQVIDKSLYVAEFQQEEPANGEENWTTLSLLTRSFNSTNLLIQEKNLHATDRYIKILFYNYKKNSKMFPPTMPHKRGNTRRPLKAKQLLQTERYPFYWRNSHELPPMRPLHQILQIT